MPGLKMSRKKATLICPEGQGSCGLSQNISEESAYLLISFLHTCTVTNEHLFLISCQQKNSLPSLMQQTGLNPGIAEIALHRTLRQSFSDCCIRQDCDHRKHVTWWIPMLILTMVKSLSGSTNAEKSESLLFRTICFGY